jgi:hypothetical protein
VARAVAVVAAASISVVVGVVVMAVSNAEVCVVNVAVTSVAGGANKSICVFNAVEKPSETIAPATVGDVVAAAPSTTGANVFIGEAVTVIIL